MFGGKDQHWTSFSISASHEGGGPLISLGVWHVRRVFSQTWPPSCQEHAGQITHSGFSPRGGGTGWLSSRDAVTGHPRRVVQRV